MLQRTRPPRILLLGAGTFGREHLKEWQHLDEAGEVQLVGVAVAGEASADRLRDTLDVPVYVGLDPGLLQEVDGVDIATPTPTHAALTRTCLEHAHVLVEKPLATTPEDALDLERHARRLGRLLMPVHQFRFHPVVRRARDLLPPPDGSPVLVTGAFVNPARQDTDRLDPSLELLHLFDIVDALYGHAPQAVSGVHRDGLLRVSIAYPQALRAVLELGWQGERHRRSLQIRHAGGSLTLDFAEGMLTHATPDRVDKWIASERSGSLRRQLRSFAEALQDPTADGAPEPAADAAAAGRVVSIAHRAAPPRRPRRPRVAVIGGGIFGATCALELGDRCDVVVYERHGALMTEASYLNQWRHHSGFHYPRSPGTIAEVRESRADFETRFGEVIVPGIDSYYFTSSSGTEITRERYLSVCSFAGLDFREAMPPPGLLDPDQVSLALLTDETIFDFRRMRQMAMEGLAALPQVDLRLGCEVIAGSIDADGGKRLRCRDTSGESEDRFDYVINATYANQNLLAQWFDLPRARLRFDLCELVVLEIPMPAIAMTVMDGPFTSLVSMGEKNLFMLSHIQHSMVKSRTTADGLPPVFEDVQSTHRNMIDAARRYFPIIDEARYVESRFGTRTVRADSADVDGRPTVITDHGFGCWSLLGGKVITCVTNAREIATCIDAEWASCAAGR